MRCKYTSHSSVAISTSLPSYFTIKQLQQFVLNLPVTADRKPIEMSTSGGEQYSQQRGNDVVKAILKSHRHSIANLYLPCVGTEVAPGAGAPPGKLYIAACSED